MSHILEYNLDEWNRLPDEKKWETKLKVIDSINEVLKSGKSQRENILNSSDSDEKKDEELIELINRIYDEIDSVLSIQFLNPHSLFRGIYDSYFEFMNETVNYIHEDSKKIPLLQKTCKSHYSKSVYLCDVICEFKEDDDKIKAYNEYIKGKSHCHKFFSRIILSFKSPKMQIQYLEDQFDYICRWARLELSELEKMENGLDGEAKEYWISLYEKYKDTYPVCKKLLSERCVNASTVGKIGTTGINAKSIKEARKELQGALTTDLGVPDQV